MSLLIWEKFKIMPRYKFVKAYGPFKWFLETYGYSGITMPWRSIYVLSPYLQDKKLRRHELVHIAQMRRDGTLFVLHQISLVVL